MINSSEVYQDIGLSTDVMSASSHRLIQLLMDKCLYHIRNAKIFITQENISKKHFAISKAKDIVSYLRACLNVENADTQELTKLLDVVYAFIEKSLLNATLHNEVTYLEQSDQVLSTVKSGWDGMTHV